MKERDANAPGRVDSWAPFPVLAELTRCVTELKVRRGRLLAKTSDGVSHIVALPKDNRRKDR